MIFSHSLLVEAKKINVSYCILIRGTLTQLAAATAAKGTNLPTIGGIDCIQQIIV